ncbi:MAG: phage tail tape measure protein, partial [Desulfuromonadaceae bacterium]|nr:phage tail tape measure protein [Desulfuromonadaceae bacterium]
MESIFALGILLKVTDMVSGPVNRMKMVIDDFARRAEALQPVFDRFKEYGAWVAGAGVAGALGLGVAVTQFANLEEAQLGLRTMLMNSTGQVGAEYEKLNTLAENLGTSLPGSTKDMLQMFTALREQGVQTNVILGGMGEAAAKFAVLMKVPFAQAATHVAKFTEALGIADVEAVPFMDILQRLKGAAGVNVTDMAESLKYMGSTLKMLRVQGLEAGRDVSAAIGMMATSAIEGSPAGTNFAMAMSRFAEIGNKLDGKKMMKEIAPLLNAKGIKLNLFDGGGNFVGIRAMMGEMEKLRKLNPQNQLLVLSKLFGQEASRPLSVFIEKGVTGFDQMLLKMKEQADMQTKINEIMSGSKMQWETLTGTISNVVAHIGGVITKVAGLTGIMKTMNNLAGKLDSWIVANPKTSGIIAGVAVALTATALAAGGLLLAIGIGGTLFVKMAGGVALAHDSLLLLRTSLTVVISRLGTLSAASTLAWLQRVAFGFRAWAVAINVGTIPALLNMTKAFWGLAVAVATNPLFWIPAAIAAVVAGFVWLYNHSINVKAGFQALAYAIGFSIGFIMRGYDSLYGLIQMAGDVIGRAYDAVVGALPSIGSAISGAFTGAYNAIVSILAQIGPAVYAAFSGVLDAIAPIFQGLYTSGQKIIGTLVDGIKSVASGPYDAISEVFDKVRNLLPFSDAKEGPLSQLTLSGSRIMTTLGEGITGEAGGLRQTMANALAGAALVTTVGITPALADMPKLPTLETLTPPSISLPTLARKAAAESGASTQSGGKSIVIQSLT